MSKIFSTALFVSCAAAQLTTSAWMAGTGGSGYSFEGSVINVENDRTTLSVSVKGLPETTDIVDGAEQTVTLGGNTYYGFNSAVSEAGVTVNIIAECTRQNTDDKEATCTMSTKGLEAVISSACASASADGEPCSDEDFDTSVTTTFPEGYFDMVQVVVTAGEDSLPSASAAATPSAGSASVTPSASDASKSAKPTTSGSEQAAASSASKTSESSPAATGAAPLVTMVPALAGLGAAAAFFL